MKCLTHSLVRWMLSYLRANSTKTVRKKNLISFLFYLPDSVIASHHNNSQDKQCECIIIPITFYIASLRFEHLSRGVCSTCFDISISSNIPKVRSDNGNVFYVRLIPNAHHVSPSLKVALQFGNNLNKGTAFMMLRYWICVPLNFGMILCSVVRRLRFSVRSV